jgi:hypothetical protein
MRTPQEPRCWVRSSGFSLNPNIFGASRPSDLIICSLVIYVKNLSITFTAWARARRHDVACAEHAVAFFSIMAALAACQQLAACRLAYMFAVSFTTSLLVLGAVSCKQLASCCSHVARRLAAMQHQHGLLCCRVRGQSLTGASAVGQPQLK